MKRSLVAPAIGLVVLLLGLGVLARWLPARDRGAPAVEEPARQPSNWAWLQRTYPHFQYDPQVYREALAARRALERAHAPLQQLRAAPTAASPFGIWQPAGPTSIGGRMVDVAFDPDTPSTIYAAAATGGVFKSVDDGTTWRPIFDEQAVLTIGDLAVAPSSPSILYVGTGEANGGHNNIAGGGVYRSDDAGATWRPLGLEATTSIGRVLVHPSDPDHAYVAAVGSYFAPNPERGVYRTTDGGDTWEQVLFIDDSTGVIDLVMHPDDPDVLFAATWQRVRRATAATLYGAGSGIYRSDDGGDTWTRLDAADGLPDPARYLDLSGQPTFGRIGLTICRDVPDVMYALYTDGHDYLGLYRSSDGGQTWFDADPDREIAAGTGGFSWYFGQVRVHPEDPDRVYVLDVSFMHSSDGGATWDITPSGPNLHVDHHALAFHPDDPDRLIDGHDGGLSVSDDGGWSFRKVEDLPVTQFYEIAFDPVRPGRYYGGTQDNGTLRTLGPGMGWERIFGGDGFYVLVDPATPDVIYVEFQFGQLFKSTDGGQTFASAMNGIPDTDKRNWSTPLAMDPFDSQTLYYGTNRLYRSINGGTVWTPISPVLPAAAEEAPLLGTISTIAVAPTDSGVLYVGTDDGRVWTSQDGGTTWTDVTAAPLPNRWVTRVVVHPQDPQTAYVTYSGLRWRDPTPHVFRTTDGGATWTAVGTDLPDAPVNAFAIDPDYPQVLYLGSDVGAFASLDAGLTWQVLSEGLPVVPVYDLKLDPATRTLLAGTHGRSMYTLDVSGVATLLGPPPTTVTTASLTPYPNPFTDAAWLQVEAPPGGTARLEVADLLGRRVALLHDGPSDDLPRRLRWAAVDAAGRRLAAGTYLARLQVSGPDGEQTVTRTLTHVR